MTNPAGARFERDVVDYLVGRGLACERAPRWGAVDRGDIVSFADCALYQWALECKAEKSYDLAGAVTEAEREARNAGRNFFAAIVKRRRKGVADAFVVMPLRIFAAFVGDADG